jgi:hypothetical protein
MSEVEGSRRWEEGPRVRVRTRVVRRSDAGRPPAEGLRADLREAERRFLSLPGGASEGLSAEAMSECLAILTSLRGISDQLQEMAGRRDLSYLADRRLTVMHDHCAWLASRVSAEFLLLLQIALERELRRVISPEAYQLYLRLEDVEEVAREVEALTGPAILARLRDGTLMREMLGRVWPEQIPAET